MSTTEAQYNAATALLKLAIEHHPETAPDDVEATFTLFQRCLAVVTGSWKPGGGQNVDIEFTCPACGEKSAVSVKIPPQI